MTYFGPYLFPRPLKLAALAGAIDSVVVQMVEEFETSGPSPDTSLEGLYDWISWVERDELTEFVGVTGWEDEFWEMPRFDRLLFFESVIFGGLGMRKVHSTGQKNLRGAHKGGVTVKEIAESRHSEYRKMALEIQSRNPNLSITSIREIVSKKAGVSIRTVRKATDGMTTENP